MTEYDKRKFEDINKRLLERFQQLKEYNPNDGRYKCWDCDKEIFHVHLDEETKKRLPMDLHGFRSLICQACSEDEKRLY